jgi:hypothetical protein
MTTLVVEELRSTLTQEFTINLTRRYSVAAIRPFIYMHNAPAGTFTLTVKKDSTSLVSKTFTSAEIKTNLSTTDNYAYLWKVIEFANPLHLEKGTFTIELSSADYTFSTASYIGWIKEFENIFNQTDGGNIDLFSNPFSYQIFEKKRPNYD